MRLVSKGNTSNVNYVIEFIETELNGSGSEIDYRQKHQRCIHGGLKVTRKTVVTINKELDPEGVDLRCKKHLRRRLYFARGPNWVWHIDGYDKLKPCSFNIHSTIDGLGQIRIQEMSVRSTWNVSNALEEFQKVVGDHSIECIRCCSSKIHCKIQCSFVEQF